MARVILKQIANWEGPQSQPETFTQDSAYCCKATRLFAKTIPIFSSSIISQQHWRNKILWLNLGEFSPYYWIHCSNTCSKISTFYRTLHTHKIEVICRYQIALHRTGRSLKAAFVWRLWPEKVFSSVCQLAGRIHGEMSEMDKAEFYQQLTQLLTFSEPLLYTWVTASHVLTHSILTIPLILIITRFSQILQYSILQMKKLRFREVPCLRSYI